MADMPTVTPPATPPAPAPLNLPNHAIVGVAIGMVAPFTGLAWPLALLTGMVIGRANVERERGIRSRATTRVVRVLAVTGGVLGMFFFGAILGGLIAFFIIALAAFSERLAGGASATDQTIARILISIIAIAIWFIALNVLKVNVSVNFGGSPIPTP